LEEERREIKEKGKTRELTALVDRYEKLLDNELVGIYVVQDGVFKYVNRGLCQIFGYREGEVIGRLGPLDLTHPEDHQLVLKKFRERIEEGREIAYYTFRGVKKDGEIFDCEVRDSQIDYEGHPAVQGILLDVSLVRRAERLRRGLLEVAGEVLASYDIEHILRRMAQAIIDHSPFQRAAISLYDLEHEPPLEGTLTQAIAIGLTAEEEQKLRESGGLTPEQRRLAFSEQFRVSESYYIPHERIPWEPGLGVPGEIKLDSWHPDDFLFIPLRGERGIIGHISVDDPTTPRAPTLEMLEPLEVFAKLAALAVERAAHLERLRHQEEELRKLSIHDPLTGLYNRHHFNGIIGRELERSRRYGHYLAFLMIDLDDFHEINNRYGHLRGDKVLCQIAELLVNNVRSSDMVFRYGGDEFLILMPETDSEVRDVTERLGRAMEEWNKGSGLDCHVGISIGATSWSPEAGRRIEEVLEEADQRMYQAKRGKSPSA